MKVLTICIFCLVAITSQAFAEENKQEELTTDNQKLSYALGLDIGSYFKTFDKDLDLEIIHRGIVDSYKDNKPLLTREEAGKIQQQFAQEQQEKQIKSRLEMITKNNQAAEDFMKENGSKEGVTTTGSGLQYKVITPGEGPKPKAEDTVKVHYKGTLMDGTEFDSSYTRNEPAVFPVDQVIPGWTEAIQLMNVGSKFQLFLPPNLAYADRGAPPVIEPGSMLIFEVELLGIEAPEAKQETQNN